MDEVNVRVRHANSGQITDSLSVWVKKPPAPPPPRSGTWTTQHFGPYAVPATTHNAGDQYFLDAEGLNASQGPYNPPVIDTKSFTVN